MNSGEEESGGKKVVRCVNGGYSQIVITTLCSAVSWVSGTIEVVAGRQGSKTTKPSPLWEQTTFVAVDSHQGF